MQARDDKAESIRLRTRWTLWLWWVLTNVIGLALSGALAWIIAKNIGNVPRDVVSISTPTVAPSIVILGTTGVIATGLFVSGTAQ